MKILKEFDGAEFLFTVNEKILNWNLEMVHGLAHSRKWEDYGFVELNFYELENYKKIKKIDSFPDYSQNHNSFIEWKVDEQSFEDLSKINKINEIYDYARFISSYISGLKGKKINFVFEIIFIGFHPVDSGNPRRDSYGRALIMAIVSCFDENAHNNELKHKKIYHNN